MMLQGKGMGWLPKTLVQRELDAGLLEILDCDLESAVLDIYIYRNQKNDNPYVAQIWPLFEQYQQEFLFESWDALEADWVWADLNCDAVTQALKRLAVASPL